jgi:hypothetical protein
MYHLAVPAACLLSETEVFFYEENGRLIFSDLFSNCKADHTCSDNCYFSIHYCQIKLLRNYNFCIPESKIAEKTIVLQWQSIFTAFAPVNKNKQSYCNQEKAVGSIEKIHDMGESEEISSHKQRNCSQKQNKASCSERDPRDPV